MEFLTDLSIGGYSLFGYIVPFLLVLTIVVFFHELGHFLVARWNKVDVEAFAVGFGPELIGFNDRRGTRWKLCAVPLGGYVKFLGDANAASVPDHERLSNLSEKEKAGSFEHKSLLQKSAVVVAGPVANFILAVLIFAGSFYVYGVHERDPVVSEVVENSAAAEAGFEVGDIVIAVDGTKIKSFSDIPRMVGPNHGYEMIFTVDRGGKLLDLPVTPKLTERVDNFGNKHKTGIVGIRNDAEDSNPRIREFGIGEAFAHAVDQTYFIIKRTVQYIGAIFVGRESADQISGIVGIAKLSGDVAKLGFVALINLTAVLSVSIGLLNLFPIPMLDGGHLVFYAYEAIFRRPMSERVQEIGFRVGFVLLIGLMLFATRNDIIRLIGE